MLYMLIVHVHVRVKPEFVDAFRQATIENARNSVAEPGIARFDVLQQADDPARFVLIEIYRERRLPPGTGRRRTMQSGAIRWPV